MRFVVSAAVVLCVITAAAAEDTGREGPPEWLKALRLRGRLAEEFAYRLHDPGDVSKLKTLGWLEGKYAFSDTANLRLATRGWYDAVFDATDRYPANVERDQKTEKNYLDLREALLSVSRRDLDVRLGRQQILWGAALTTPVTGLVNHNDAHQVVLPE